MRTLEQIKQLFQDETQEIVETTLDNFVKDEYKTYYLDELDDGSFMISQDEFPLSVFNNELDARERFEYLRTK